MNSPLKGPSVTGRILPYQSIPTFTCLTDIWQALIRCPRLVSHHPFYQGYHRVEVLRHLETASDVLRFFFSLLSSTDKPGNPWYLAALVSVTQLLKIHAVPRRQNLWTTMSRGRCSPLLRSSQPGVPPRHPFPSPLRPQLGVIFPPSNPVLPRFHMAAPFSCQPISDHD